MLWAFWQDYHNYEQIDKDEIGGEVYDGRLDNSGIDTPLVFNVLSEQDWSTLDGLATSRDVHSIQDMGYKYEANNFIADNNVDSADLDENWFIPNGGRRRMVVGNSGTPTFQHIMYNQLVQQYGGSLSGDSYDERRQIMETIALMQCEYRNIGDHECRRPKNFDDFSDRPLGPNRYSEHDDLDVTLAELIEAVAAYPCMVETREMMFPWVSKLGGIWRLARGDFDRFCDRSFLRDDNDEGTERRDQCMDRGYIKSFMFEKSMKTDSNPHIVNNMELADTKNEVASTADFLQAVAIIGIIIILCSAVVCYRRKGIRKDSLLNGIDHNNQYSSFSSI